MRDQRLMMCSHATRLTSNLTDRSKWPMETGANMVYGPLAKLAFELKTLNTVNTVNTKSMCLNHSLPILAERVVGFWPLHEGHAGDSQRQDHYEKNPVLDLLVSGATCRPFAQSDCNEVHHCDTFGVVAITTSFPALASTAAMCPTGRSRISPQSSSRTSR